jgi:hypothetical protein
MHPDEGLFEQTDLDRATQLQNGLVAEATGNAFDGGDPAYKELRRYFAQRADTKGKLPDFVRRCSDLAQFWGWIKYEKPSYAERRQLIWGAFRPLIDYLEGLDRTPGVVPITEALEGFDPDNVHGFGLGLGHGLCRGL